MRTIVSLEKQPAVFNNLCPPGTPIPAEHDVFLYLGILLIIFVYPTYAQVIQPKMST
jgi:hypothetical protein